MSMPEGDVNALENRLATHAVYDDGNKRLLEQLPGALAADFAERSLPSLCVRQVLK